MLLVAEPNEPYVGKVCKDVITEFYTASPKALDASLAPLLPPFVLQNLVEGMLSSIEAEIPRYLTSSCLVAQREIMCALTMMEPYALDQLHAVFGTVYLPKYPARNLCERYMDSCSALIGVMPQLALNCSQHISPGVSLFPTKPQVRNPPFPCLLTYDSRAST